MLRQIIKPKTEKYLLNIPKEYLNKRVEILVLPYENSEDTDMPKKSTGIIAKTAGILKNKNIDPVKWQRKIRNEWDGRT